MSKWLTAYREGHWKEESEAWTGLAQGARVEWRSPSFGRRAGRVVLDSEDGWLLLKGEHTPDLLVWVREDLCHA